MASSCILKQFTPILNSKYLVLFAEMDSRMHKHVTITIVIYMYQSDPMFFPDLLIFLGLAKFCSFSLWIVPFCYVSEEGESAISLNSSGNLISFLLISNFFLGVVVSCTLPKLVKSEQVRKYNNSSTQSTLISHTQYDVIDSYHLKNRKGMIILELDLILLVTQFNDPVYANTYVTVQHHHIILGVTVINRTKETLQNLCFELAIMGDLKLVIAEPDVVLTTYGVLTAAYKKDLDDSIFRKVDWYRVVLDEAHTIKSSRTQGAQAAFKLSAYCRWCLTGTPRQNNLEDLYSLLCFLHVEPWCNWAWWNKLIQRPYENGDQRGLKLVKAILRPLMLRRSKDTKDKHGRPILVLPPTDIKIIECEQSEAEHDFYDALFRRSKVQFDQFVAQGKVLHNYANILELLLRLRQCCNHPYLVMSRGDAQKYTDLDKLARRFLESNGDSTRTIPSKAYVEEVVENLRRGENAECPICLESADDPVLTPCAHRMCRECLLSSWWSTSAGMCPICRQLINKNDLITCPSDNKFRVDIDKDWKESSKVSKLLDCLERVCSSGEKSIVFSQWTSFLDLLEIPLKRRGIKFLRFDGKLAQKNRERVLKEFNETEDKMVMLMSLKAGGVGLNLTAASNVFLMDPWWNPAVEEQAIMRIHRIGQKRTVRVRRFIVKDTVEERMQQVQARKQRMISGALTDEEVRSARLEELKMLFR